MNFKQTLQSLLNEMDEEDGIDVLDQEQETEVPELETSNDLKQLLDLTNVLLNAFKLKVSKETKAYTLMPAFRKLKPYEQLAWVRNLLVDNPERVMQEMDEIEDIEDFGNTEEIVLDEESQKDILRLILRAVRANPFTQPFAISKLPSRANQSNYREVIETIEGLLG